MKFVNEDIGSKILEIITSGLYDGNPNCLREYTQNSIDAEAKNIKIYYENGKNDLVIKDDGEGMDKDDLKYCLGIGRSKKGESDVGWRGIGIWSGSSNCSRIVIVTKKRNGSKIRVEIDNEIIRKGIRIERPLLQVLTDATSEIEEEPLGKDESLETTHFTIIRLEGILRNQKYIFDDVGNIKDYLQKTIPLSFNADKFSFSESISAWLKEKGVAFSQIPIEFEGEILFRPPFKSDIFFDKVIKKEFVSGGKLVAVGWALTSKENRVLLEPNRGIYFKKKGFTLGDENLVKNQHLGTYNPWQYGEIHIISKEIRENAARNNFEYNSDLVKALLDQVKDFVGSLQLQNQYQSDRIVSNRIRKANRLIEKSDIQSAKKEVRRAETSLKRERSFPNDPSLKGMKEIIDAHSLSNKKELNKLKRNISGSESSQLISKDDLSAVWKGLPENIRKTMAFTTHGRLKPAAAITDPIKYILEKKTGIEEDEFVELTKKAYGWREVKGDIPILFLDKDPRRKYRNHNFGVLIYTIHDLFVNLYKHKRSKWFDKLPEEERDRILIEMLTTIDWIYKLIEQSEK